MSWLLKPAGSVPLSPSLTVYDPEVLPLFVTVQVVSLNAPLTRSVFSSSGFSSSGFSSSGFSSSGFSSSGFRIDGLTTVAFSSSGFSSSGFSSSGFSSSGLRTVAFVMSRLCTSAFSSSGFSSSGFSSSGFSSSGLVGSGLRTIVPCWPLGTGAPLGAVISTTPTLICAWGSVDRANTVRATVDLLGTWTSSVSELLELLERRLYAGRRRSDCQPVGAYRRAVVLREDRKAPLQRRAERPRVAQSADDEAARDPRGVDVLVPHPGLSRHARRNGLARIEAALRRPSEVRGIRRRVIRPHTVPGRADVTIVGPDSVEDRARRSLPC